MKNFVNENFFSSSTFCDGIEFVLLRVKKRRKAPAELLLGVVRKMKNARNFFQFHKWNSGNKLHSMHDRARGEKEAYEGCSQIVLIFLIASSFLHDERCLRKYCHRFALLQPLASIGGARVVKDLLSVKRALQANVLLLS